jgi:hypothetical protein
MALMGRIEPSDAGNANGRNRRDLGIVTSAGYRLQLPPIRTFASPVTVAAEAQQQTFHLGVYGFTGGSSLRAFIQIVQIGDDRIDVVVSQGGGIEGRHLLPRPTPHSGGIADQGAQPSFG